MATRAPDCPAAVCPVWGCPEGDCRAEGFPDEEGCRTAVEDSPDCPEVEGSPELRVSPVAEGCPEPLGFPAAEDCPEPPASRDYLEEGSPADQETEDDPR